VDRDGLLTNDKFCFVRESCLTLNHWRGPLRKRGLSVRQRTLLKKHELSGVDDVRTTAVGHPENERGNRRRSAALGSGVAVSPEVVSSDERKGDR
jgi:hypothetical protein